MEIDGIAAILHLDIVDAAEEIVRVGVHAMCGPWRIDISPAARNRDLEVADAQEGQHSIHRRVDATHQAAQFFQFVQCMTRLPSNATVERRQVASHLVQSVADRCVDRPMDFRPQLTFPHEGRKQSHDLCSFGPEYVFGSHGTLWRPDVRAQY